MQPSKTAKWVIETFGLEPLPEEGGFFRETYRDAGQIPASSLQHHEGPRAFSTCIYYLVTPEEFSGLHAVKSTEIFHFYAGAPVRMIQIDERGVFTEVILGNDLGLPAVPQVIVPPNVWQGTKLVEGGDWALLGCTVAPGFDFSDFQGGKRAELLELFPHLSDEISSYTRG